MSQWGRSARTTGERPTLQPIADFPTRPKLIARGLLRRCPWCGDRKAYFLGWFRRQEHCRNCGHGYRRGDHAFELGATTANFILTLVVLLITVPVTVVATLPDANAWIGVGAAVAVALLGPIVFASISFTLWQAIDLWMRPPTPEELAGESEATL